MAEMGISKEIKISCVKCGRMDLTVADFHKSNTSKTGFASICKVCHKNYQLKRFYETYIKKNGLEAFRNLVLENKKKLLIAEEILSKIS